MTQSKKEIVEVVLTNNYSSSSTDLVFGGDDNKQRLVIEPLLNIINNYLSYYASGDSHTAKAKRYDLQYFIEFLSSSKKIEEVAVSDWTLQKTKDFIDYRLKLGESPSTVSRRLATIKHFGRTLAERFPGYINPAREAKSPSFSLSAPKGLSEEEIKILKDVISIPEENPGFKKVRDKFLIELLLATGLRADEVRLLTFGQIDKNYSWLTNVKTKGKKFRKVYLNKQIKEELTLYLQHRNNELLEKFPAFFSFDDKSKNKYPVIISSFKADLSKPDSFTLNPKTIWKIISKAGKKAQIESKNELPSLHPHRLRHTFAHGLLDSSKDVRLVAQALGHSDVRTTMRYTERGDEEIASAIEASINKNT